MQELVREYLNELSKKQKKRRKKGLAAILLVVLVVGGVIGVLTQYGVAMTGDVKCGLEEHTHTEACYTNELVCGLEESEGHIHTEACQYPAELVCGLEETESQEGADGEVIEGHTHTEACYSVPEGWACGQEESEGHTHTEACYESRLSCGMEEHTHTDLCYIDTTADVEDASVWDTQYENAEWKEVWSEDLAAAARPQVGYKESADNYTVTEDGNRKGYTRYGQFAGDIYADWDAAFVNFCMHYAGMKESGIFPDEIDTSKWIEAFGKLNEQSEKYEAYMNCFTEAEDYIPETGDIIFFQKENEETTDQMGIVSSYDEEKNEIKVIEGNSGNEVKENTYEIGDTHIVRYLMTAKLEEAYKKEAGNEAGTGNSEAEGTDGAEGTEVTEETAETEEPAEDENADEEIVKTYTADTFTVTASYKKDANIPEEAELIAEEIIAEGNEEHYSERESELQETVGNEKVSMRALIKVGFYVNGEEVEPESPVTITIQFLDEAGLAEGSPITVVHFADEGAEMLDGGTAKDNSTTFQTESFSEFAIIEDMKDAKPGESRPINRIFQYEDEVFHIDFHVVGNAVMTEEKMDEDIEDEEDAETVVKEGEDEETAKKYQFKVKKLDEESEEYQKFAKYAEETKQGENQLLLNVMQFSLFYEKAELDLADCEVTAEITPTKELAEYIPTGEEEEQKEIQESEEEEKEELSFSGFDSIGSSQKNMLLGNKDESTDEFLDSDVVEEVAQEVFVSVFDQTDDGTISKLDTVSVNKDKIEEGNPVTAVTVSNNTLGTGVEDPTNPEFTVQYYTIMPRAVTDASQAANCAELTIINTEKSGNNEGGNLPENGTTPATKSIFVDKSDGTVKMVDTLTEIYASRDLSYFKAPTINYFDVLINRKTNYGLEKILVSRDGGSNWETYIYNSKLHFTNREEAATAKENDADGGYVWISDKAILRLLYKMEEEPQEFGASFYDYDISSVKKGNAYVTQAGGINTSSNYAGGSGARYAFGNANTGTDAALEKVEGLGYINVRNKTEMERRDTGDVGPKDKAVDYGYAGCAFKLVDGMSVDSKGNPVIDFAPGIVGPENLFGNVTDKVMEGKTEYSGKLTFDRKGDVHTLTTANVNGAKGAANLNSFKNPGDSEKTYYNIWTNSFWPMDSATDKRHDPEFGKRNDTERRTQYGEQNKNKITNFPTSDDFQNHNSYFGMTYQVDFELTGDYVGPLEYYFFGDDDMWVFLSSKNDSGLHSSQLICDIGGLHSAVGEYVNLWDYLPKDANGTYTLSFFYTERGASGSTCWMQFTLPSVSTKEPEKTLKDYGNLIVKKEVEETKDGEEVTDYPGNDEFSFTIYLRDQDEQSPLADDYSYIVYNKDGEEIGSNIVDRTAVHDGSKFTLKDGDWIKVMHIPKGTYYEIVENTSSIKIGTIDYNCNTTLTVTGDSDHKIDSQNRKVSGHIKGDAEITVQYVNKVDIYTLPSTGGLGIYWYMFSGVLLISIVSLITYRKNVRRC